MNANKRILSGINIRESQVKGWLENVDLMVNIY